MSLRHRRPRAAREEQRHGARGGEKGESANRARASPAHEERARRLVLICSRSRSETNHAYCRETCCPLIKLHFIFTKLFLIFVFHDPPLRQKKPAKAVVADTLMAGTHTVAQNGPYT